MSTFMWKAATTGSCCVIAALTISNIGMKEQYKTLNDDNYALKQQLLAAYDSINQEKQANNISSVPSYLNPATLRNLGFCNCPYTNPTYPSVGPDQSFICPKTRPYYSGASWYLKTHSQPYISDPTDKQNLDLFFECIERVRNIIKEYCKTNYKYNDIDITLKTDDRFHLTYQYLNCQSKGNIQILYRNEKEIFGNDEYYMDILNEFGFNSWKDIVISFDKTLCMVDHSSPTITFDLFLDDTSQELMKRLIERTEYMEEHKYGIKPYLKRNLHQQAFHFTIGSIYIDKNDYNEFDSKGLMDKINEEMELKFPSIKLLNYPHLDEKMMVNTYELKDQYKFKKKKIDVFD